MDTNALLSIALAMIANFTNIVEVPPSAVPTKASDLARFVIGRPGWPLHMILTHHAGTEFWINNGAIYSYSSPGSFFTLQDPALIPKFTGTTSLTTNDVVRIAEKALRRLVKSGDPLRGGPPVVWQASEYKGQRIPFFRVRWPKPPPGGDPVAEVEIDGRTGRIVTLDTWGDGFRDPAFQQEMSKRVHAPEVIRPPPPADWEGYPKPAPGKAAEAIRVWLAFCRALGLDAGTQTNVDDVDWGSSWVSPQANEPMLPRWGFAGEVCRIKFKNGVAFESEAGVVYCHFSAGSILLPTREGRQWSEWESLQGQPSKKWEDLAKDLEAGVLTHLAVSGSLCAKMRSLSRSPAEYPPGHPLKLAIVGWRMLIPRPDVTTVSPEERLLLGLLRPGTSDGSAGLSPKELQFVKQFWYGGPSERYDRAYERPGEEIHVLEHMPNILRVEFDLQTGEIKSIEFGYPEVFWPGLRKLAEGK
jgi:hypothetical protein